MDAKHTDTCNHVIAGYQSCRNEIDKGEKCDLNELKGVTPCLPIFTLKGQRKLSTPQAQHTHSMHNTLQLNN